MLTTNHYKLTTTSLSGRRVFGFSEGWLKSSVVRIPRATATTEWYLVVSMFRILSYFSVSIPSIGVESMPIVAHALSTTPSEM